MDAITTALTSGFTSAASDIFSILAIAVPAAIGVMAVILAVRVGIRQFKGLAK